MNRRENIVRVLVRLFYRSDESRASAGRSTDVGPALGLSILTDIFHRTQNSARSRPHDRMAFPVGDAVVVEVVVVVVGAVMCLVAVVDRAYLGLRLKTSEWSSSNTKR